MKYFATKAFALLSMLLLSSVALAHSGHDHSHVSSMALHVMFYGAVVAVIAAAGYFSFKAIAKKSDK